MVQFTRRVRLSRGGVETVGEHLWGHRLALAIALATGGAAVLFAAVAFMGAPVEPRTGAALVFRLAVWSVIAWLSSPRKHS